MDSSQGSRSTPSLPHLSQRVGSSWPPRGGLCARAPDRYEWLVTCLVGSSAPTNQLHRAIPPGNHRISSKQLLAGLASRAAAAATAEEHEEAEETPSEDELELDRLLPCPEGAPPAGYPPKALGLLDRLRATSRSPSPPTSFRK